MKLVRLNNAWHICFMNRAGELMSDCGEIKASRHGEVLKKLIVSTQRLKLSQKH